MTESRLEARLDGDGPAAPPRSNGELVFEAPWQGRAFGMVMGLAEAGVFDYEDFRVELIGAIAEAESHARDDTVPFAYYACWLSALERVLAARGLVDGDALDALVTRYAQRPHDHDHDHDHESWPA